MFSVFVFSPGKESAHMDTAFVCLAPVGAKIHQNGDILQICSVFIAVFCRTCSAQSGPISQIAGLARSTVVFTASLCLSVTSKSC